MISRTNAKPEFAASAYYQTLATVRRQYSVQTKKAGAIVMNPFVICLLLSFGL